MDVQQAEREVADLRTSDRASWRDRTHIATTCFRKGVVRKLSADPQIADDGMCALAEIHLSEVLPEIDEFHGIFAVDEVGIWYYDGDGHVEDAVWRQRLIPWRYVTGLVLHQTS